MQIEQWLAFAAASAVILAIPGPTVLLVVSYALSHGRSAARATVAGVALGDFTAMTASLLGMGAILVSSATLFTALKWAGAAYLIYLGVKLWRAPVAVAEPDEAPGPARAPSVRIFLHAYAVTALNPKSIVFFVAFLPQFIDVEAAILPQIVVAEATFLVLAALNAAAYGLLAARVAGWIRRPSIRVAVNRTGGALMMAAGLAAALSRRAPA